MKASEIDVESMELGDRLALYTRIEASLPATSLRNLSLEKTLVLQLLTAQELQKDVLEDEAATPTHKSQVTNTLSGIIDALSKLQIKLFNSERMKEIEAVLITHPSVGDVAVIGVPNVEWGEEVKAVVETQPGVAPGEELAAELLEYARERLSGYKVPRTVDFTDRLPREDNGKLYKRKLRDEYRAAAIPSADARSDR